MEKYDSKKIEAKWQEKWAKTPDFYVAEENSKKKKQYILDMFPYPSGEGLHVGHVESYTATDIISRYLRMQGKNILHPQGWDAFGLPAENYAIKTKIHPSVTTKKSIATFKGQMNKMGFSYDWSREVNSSDPEYYKWTQWFFLLLYKNGLAYKKLAKANWCSSCQTVLANEQVVNGKCERCGTVVIQKDLEQWFFKITNFIEDSKKTKGLISGLDKVDWPESIKAAQKNWIGRSEGAIIKFKVQSSKFKDNLYLEVFTTRLDTIYGCTYCVVAPEHPIIAQLKSQITNIEEVEKYLTDAKKKTDLERMEAKVKTGAEIKGIKVINPFNKEEVPLYVADYVLSHYGTGAVMAVPAHDERDWDFSEENRIIIKHVINPVSEKYINVTNVHPVFSPKLRTGENIEAATERWKKQEFDLIKKGEKCFSGDGVLINSGEYSRFTSQEAREKMAAWLEKNKLGEKKINYKIRDWLVSRQRYWGAPIPIIYCKKCGTVPVPEKNLPVELPTDVDFKPTGESPLKYSKKFQDVKCPKCGGKARRESDTMDTFVCSSWYYFRYSDPKNEKEFASRKQLKKWLPVDLYVGGAEHAVLHLLYSRFFTKVLHSLGYIDFDEPFLKLRNQGLILAEDGRKMSKSLGNVINPDEIVNEFGADSLRLFEMFMGPLEDMKPWQTQGIIGIDRFLKRIWNYLEWEETHRDGANESSFEKWKNGEVGETSVSLKLDLSKMIKKVTGDIENLKFNTAISSLMTFLNIIYKFRENKSFPGRVDMESTFTKGMHVNDFKKFVKLLSPFAPHIAEELWEKLGHKESIFLEKWPSHDPELIKDEEIELVIQVNGKLRDRIKVVADISEEEAKKNALGSEKVKKYILEKKAKKIIFVKNKLINIVI